MIELNAITTLCLACILYLLGKAIVNHVNFLKRICIPAPVIGGLIFAILVAALDSFGMVKIKLDASFIQDFFMLAFFTTIGLGASLKLFKLGGKVLLLYFMFCAIISVIQNIVGVSLAKVLNIKPLLGLTAGSMSMEGGHGNAAAYGKTIQDLGIDSALTAALAAATLGLVFGGLIGGPVVKFLIKRYNLKPQHSDDTFKDYSQVAYNEHLHSKFNATEVFFIQFTIVVFCMAVGSYFSHLFTAQTGINVPIYVGSLFVAVIVRNISESFNFNIVDIENERRANKDMDYLSSWGQSTVESLLETTAYQSEISVFASGGLRTPLDAIKSLALGAKATGMSRPFLNQVENNGIAHTVAYVESFIEHMKSIMTMLDAKNIDDLTQKQIVFSPEILSWIEQRNLNIHRG